ncbi:MAG: hypothetical protein N2B02_06180, partial [Amylibacter sp.]
MSADAQRIFNLGLNWCFGFNQEEGVACFQRVLEHDPTCAIAHWGLAYSAGPFYNLPWCDLGDDETVKMTRFCYDHAQMAKKLSIGCSDAEIGLIDALLQRFHKPYPVMQTEFNQWDDDYADAMRQVYHKYPDDFDVIALYVEALITRTPWKLWNVKTGEPNKGADTFEALEACERAIAMADQQDIPQHPAILHLHIHVTEMSDTPERAMRSADLLSTACPDAGHMNHMP